MSYNSAIVLPYTRHIVIFGNLFLQNYFLQLWNCSVILFFAKKVYKCPLITNVRYIYKFNKSQHSDCRAFTFIPCFGRLDTITCLIPLMKPVWSLGIRPINCFLRLLYSNMSTRTSHCADGGMCTQPACKTTDTCNRYIVKINRIWDFVQITAARNKWRVTDQILHSQYMKV